jgi:hypothetical protein
MSSQMDFQVHALWAPTRDDFYKDPSLPTLIELQHSFAGYGGLFRVWYFFVI